MSLIKSPADYVASMMKAFSLDNSKGYTYAMRKMGQELYLPRDVAGWQGGAAWLMTTSLLARYQFAESVSKRLNGNLLVSDELTPKEAESSEQWVRLWSKYIGIYTLSETTLKALSQFAEATFVYASQKNAGMRGLMQMLFICPEAQMK